MERKQENADIKKWGKWIVAEIAPGSVPVLNISITDWVALNTRLIQTPKDFYKTSISLSSLWFSGIHRGRKSRKKKKKEKEEVSYLHYVVESCFSSSAVLFNHSDKRYYGLVMLWGLKMHPDERNWATELLLKRPCEGYHHYEGFGLELSRHLSLMNAEHLLLMQSYIQNMSVKSSAESLNIFFH